jgi:hypothetical protein
VEEEEEEEEEEEVYSVVSCFVESLEIFLIFSSSLFSCSDYKQKPNSVALVRKRTIPTERSSLVGEVSANFSG